MDEIILSQVKAKTIEQGWYLSGWYLVFATVLRKSILPLADIFYYSVVLFCCQTKD